MATYELLGGGKITANNPFEIVSKLNENSIFGSKGNLNDFMNTTAKACFVQKRANIRTKNFVLFVEDLKRHGFIKEVDNV